MFSWSNRRNLKLECTRREILNQRSHIRSWWCPLELLQLARDHHCHPVGKHIYFINAKSHSWGQSLNKTHTWQVSLPGAAAQIMLLVIFPPYFLLQAAFSKTVTVALSRVCEMRPPMYTKILITNQFIGALWFQIVPEDVVPHPAITAELPA
jgi:hypothetical protein